VLDQRRLPAEEIWLRCERVEEVAEAIRTLAVRGAPAIGLAAAYGLALADADDREAAAEVLRSTRPTAVDLGWALDRALEAADPEAFALALAAERLAADERLAALGAARCGSGERVLTHCNTGALATGGYGTALGVIRAAWDAGKVGRVWIGETRPLLQGARLTTWELGRAGIPHELVVDAAVGSLFARGLVDRVIVGADRIAANGDVANKVGTYALAVLAARHGVPFDVAAPTSTLDPATPDGAAIPIEERTGDEVTSVLGRPAAPAGTAAANPAFDVTPADLVSAIVTEAGVLEPPYDLSTM
jgi:methylthioribose-1-phosphate isomerase